MVLDCQRDLAQLLFLATVFSLQTQKLTAARPSEEEVCWLENSPRAKDNLCRLQCSSGWSYAHVRSYPGFAVVCQSSIAASCGRECSSIASRFHLHSLLRSKADRVFRTPCRTSHTSAQRSAALQSQPCPKNGRKAVSGKLQGWWVEPRATSVNLAVGYGRALLQMTYSGVSLELQKWGGWRCGTKGALSRAQLPIIKFYQSMKDE